MNAISQLSNSKPRVNGTWDKSLITCAEPPRRRQAHGTRGGMRTAKGSPSDRTCRAVPACTVDIRAVPKILARIFNYLFSGLNAVVFASSLSRVLKILFLSFLRFSESCCSIPHVHSASKQFTSSSAVSSSSPKSKPNAIKLKCGRSILKRISLGSSLPNFHFSKSFKIANIR